MPVRKNTFSCGHIGKGSYCHRCREEKKQKRKELQARSAWERRLDASPVQLDKVPRKIAEKTLDVIAKLEKGIPYSALNGKRLGTMGQRNVISLPIGRRYRLVCGDGDGAWKYIEVLSHEKYSNRLSTGGWSR